MRSIEVLTYHVLFYGNNAFQDLQTQGWLKLIFYKLYFLYEWKGVVIVSRNTAGEFIGIKYLYWDKNLVIGIDSR